MKKNYIIPIFIPHLGCPNDCIFCNQKKIAKDYDAQKEENIKLLKSIAAQAKDTILFLNDMDEQKFPDQDGEL